MDVCATKDQGNAEPQRFWNREDAKGAKGFIYFLIGTDDQKKNHGLTRKDQGNAEPRLNPPQYDLPDLRGKLRSSLHEFNPGETTATKLSQGRRGKRRARRVLFVFLIGTPVKCVTLLLS